jgi:DNA-binding transcriptional MocR family regulator
MTVARYKRLVDRFATEIRSGQLPPGTRLPTHRQLAATEKVALVTATRVYAELEAMGLVIGEAGRGTFVREIALPASLGMDQQAIAADIVDLNFNYPALPEQAELLRSALRQLAVSGDLDAFLRCHPHAGRPHERAIFTQHLAISGVEVKPEQLLVVNGAQHGLAVVVMALLQPGDVVAVDALTYPGFKALAEQCRLDLVPLPASDSGPDLDTLERLCKKRPVRAIYAMPTVHNPLGWVQDIESRTRLVALARRHDLILIEDAPYAFLEQNPPPPLAALAPERCVHVTALSKSVAAGIRVGFIASPIAWIPRLERVIRATIWNTPAAMTSLACAWLADGTVGRLVSEKRRDAMTRQAVVAEVLAGMRPISHPASYFIWLPMPEDVRAEAVAISLLERRISVSTAEPFSVGASTPHALRIALGSVDLKTLRQALSIVREVIERA